MGTCSREMSLTVGPPGGGRPSGHGYRRCGGLRPLARTSLRDSHILIEKSVSLVTTLSRAFFGNVFRNACIYISGNTTFLFLFMAYYNCNVEFPITCTCI